MTYFLEKTDNIRQTMLSQYEQQVENHRCRILPEAGNERREEKMTVMAAVLEKAKKRRASALSSTATSSLDFPSLFGPRVLGRRTRPRGGTEILNVIDRALDELQDIPEEGTRREQVRNDAEEAASCSGAEEFEYQHPYASSPPSHATGSVRRTQVARQFSARQA